MRARTLLVVVLAVLALSAQPVAAQNASTVASEHTTFGTGGGEPAPTQTNNSFVTGSGESASVVALKSGTTTDISDSQNYSGTPRDFRAGYAIELSDDISRLAAVLHADSGATTAYIHTTDGTMLAQTTISNNKAVFTGLSLTAGDRYYITADAEGAEYTIPTEGSPSYSYTADKFEVYTGVSNGLTYDNAYNFVRLETGTDSSRVVGANHAAGNISAGWTNLTLKNASATVTWQSDADGDGTWTNVTSTSVSTTTNVTQDLSGTTSDRWRVRADISATGADPVAEIHDEGVLFDPAAPTLSDPAPSGVVESRGDSVRVNVSDADFSFAQNDAVTVTATDSDGSEVGSQTVTSNGTVSFNYDSSAGSNEITWTATDSYGHSDTLTQTFTTPSVLYIRPESDPDALVDGSNVSIEVRFYTGDAIYTRMTSDGTVSLAGLPAGERFAVVLSAEGYYRRRLIIDSLYQQQTAYMLNDSMTAAEKQFVLNDVGGNYPAESTRLYIQRSINNSTGYQTVAADYFGATSSFSTFLQTDQRYRLVIENDRGDRRVLGSYTPIAAGVERLKIEGVSLYQQSQEGYIANASTQRLESGQRQVIVRYRDAAAATSEYQVRVHERGAPENVTYTDSVSGTVENYSAYVNVENNTNYVVNWSATRNGNQIRGTVPVGGGDLGIQIPLDPQWLGTLGLLMLVFVASLAGERFATHIAMAVVAFAGVLMYLAVIDLFIPGWWAGLVIAVGGHVAQRRPAS